jgi:hypothetical protein
MPGFFALIRKRAVKILLATAIILLRVLLRAAPR